MGALWEEIKKKGSPHYKGGKVEPIDLILEGGMLWDKAIADIIKYAYRNRRELGHRVNPLDVEKLRHCVDMLKMYT